MNDYLIYESAMQVVPLLLIALFLDNRSTADTPRSTTGRRLLRIQDRFIAGLGFIAFFTSMFVLAHVVKHSSVTSGIVIAAMGGATGLLFGLIWKRLS
ncbi:hypothetical protein [Micromonospora sp. 067-2]|uniref:hypothetical protein n=1 Tax=Micromonospora sp. 067-2 TaxID=2789270 RepID=UPI00397BA7AF